MGAAERSSSGLPVPRRDARRAGAEDAADELARRLGAAEEPLWQGRPRRGQRALSPTELRLHSSLSRREFANPGDRRDRGAGAGSTAPTAFPLAAVSRTGHLQINMGPRMIELEPEWRLERLPTDQNPFDLYTATPRQPWALGARKPSSQFQRLERNHNVAETCLGCALIVGLFTRWSALASGILLLLFALGMSVGTGVKSALNASVFSASAAAFALSTRRVYAWSIDAARASRLARLHSPSTMGAHHESNRASQR